MAKPVTAPTEFAHTFLPDFYAEIGEAEDCQEEIASLIEALIHNPYEPELIRSCYYVSRDNDLFIFRLTGDCSYEISWRTFNTSSDPLTIINQDWEVKFLFAKRYS